MSRWTAEFVTLREACGLSQTRLSALFQWPLRTVQALETDFRRVQKKHIDALRNLDDLIRYRAGVVLQPVMSRTKDAEPVALIRYRDEKKYLRTERDHAKAGLCMDCYHAMLGRVIDGLNRLGVRYVVRFNNDPAEVPEPAEVEEAEVE